MNKTKFLTVALSVVMVSGALVGTSGCFGKLFGQKLDDKPLEAKMVADYTKMEEDRKETFASGSKGYSWENGEPFNTWWNPKNVSYENNKLSLSISEMTKKEQVWDESTQTNKDCISEYYGAEERSEHYYGYGDFQVRMKPAKVVGTASTFFTCTGPYDVWYNEAGEVVKRNDHDEIDIEFLGKDTTKVQFNYFANGVGDHEYMYNLGFDASKEYHNYGFRWTEKDITWFVDEEPVYKVERAKIKKGEEWPEEPGRMIMNYWCGTEKASSWMGKFKEDYSGRAEYEWIKSSATALPDPSTTKPAPAPDPEPDTGMQAPTTGWADIDYSNFGGWGGYTIDKANGLTISHSEPKTDWACEGMALANSYTWVKFNLKNNGTEAADLRIDYKKEGGANAVVGVVANEGISYNATDKAVNVHIKAGATVEVVAKIDETLPIDQMVIFLNSTGADMAKTGSVTITNLQGVVNANLGNTGNVPTGKVIIREAYHKVV